MNRLIVTLMLIVTMALGLSKLAKADKTDVPPPLQDLSTSADVNGGKIQLERKEDGSIKVWVKSVDNCEECTNHIEMSEVDDSFKAIAKTAKTAKEIKEAAAGAVTDDANKLIANEKLRVKLQKQIDQEIAECKIAKESSVDSTGDHPVPNRIKFDNSWDGNRSGPGEHKDKLFDNEASSTANVQIPASVQDDVDHVAFTKKDECVDEKLNDPDVSTAVKQKLLAASLTEWSELDEKAQKGMLAPGSKEMIRYQALQGYLKNMGNKPEFKAFAANFMQNLALRKNQDILAAANAAGGSSQAALDARLNGNLSQASIAHFKSLIDMGSTFGGTQSFSQFNLSNLNRLVTTIDKNTSKASAGGSSANDMYAAAYKAGGGSDAYDSALKTANGIYDRFTRDAGMGAETGNRQFNDSVTKLDPRAISRPALFTPRNPTTANLNCGASATAYASTFNTGNAYANSVPQSCYSQTGQNLGVANYQSQVSTPNYQTTSNNGFSIPNRTTTF